MIEEASNRIDVIANNAMAMVRVVLRVLERGNLARDGSTICTRKSNRRTTPTEVDGLDWVGPEEIVVVTVAVAAVV